MKTKLLFLFFICLNFNLSAQTPTNDECEDRETITVTTASTTTVNTDNSSATQSQLGSCNNSSQTWLDVWYEFSMPVNGNIRITDADGTDNFTLYTACGGTEIQCESNNSFFTDLDENVTYVLRYAQRDVFADSNSFSIQAFAEVTNDECADRETITVTTASTTTVNTETRGATQSLLSSCNNSSQTWFDVWYEFSMPVDGNIRITDADGTDNFTLYDACGGTEIQCGSNNEYFYNLTENTTYVLRYTQRDIFANSSSFNIQAFNEVTNDECADKETITVTTATTTAVNTETRGATQSLQSSCNNSSQTWLDVWYEFTMPVNGNISITDASSIDNFTLYDACGGTEIQCGSNDEFFFNLTEDTTYVLRYAQRDIFASSGSFNIQAFVVVPNDECAGSETISVSTENITTVNTDTQSATQSLLSNCDNSSQTWLDVWYEFTMPVNGNIRITEADSTDNFTLYTACGGAEIQCGSNDEYFYGLSAGVTYKLRYAQRDIFASSDSFDIQAFESINNNICSNAETIQVSTTGNCEDQNQTIDFRGSPLATTIPSCVNNTQTWVDAWYTFDATATGNISIQTTNSLTSFTLYDACNGTELVCFENNGTLPVVAGQTYYLQVSIQDFFANTSTFCLEQNPNIATGTAGNCEDLPTVEISPAENNTNTWVPILDASGNIVLALNANGNDLGVINTKLLVDNNDVRDYNGQSYLRREIVIDPTNQPSSNVDVRLFLLEDEMNDLLAADSNLSNINQLEVMKVDGTECTSGYSEGGNFILTGTNNYLNDYYINFSTDSFSVFYPSSTNLSNLLSVEDFDNINSKINVYPTVLDDTNTIFIKSSLNIGESTISIFDTNGRLIKTSKNSLNNLENEYEVKDLDSGLYFIKIESEQISEVKRFIKL